MVEFRRWLEEETASRHRREVDGRRRRAEETAQAAQVAEEVRQQRAALADLQRRVEQSSSGRAALSDQNKQLWRAVAAVHQRPADAVPSPHLGELAPQAPLVADASAEEGLAQVRSTMEVLAQEAPPQWEEMLATPRGARSAAGGPARTLHLWQC